MVSTVERFPRWSVDPHIKHRSRINYWLAEKDARRNFSGAQPLLVAPGGLTETPTANFLMVANGVVFSPPRDDILDGISLHIVEDLCEELGIEMKFRRIAWKEAENSDEAMLSSTPYCLAGVRSIHGHKVPWPGPIMQRLIEAWSADVGVDIHGQFANVQ